MSRFIPRIYYEGYFLERKRLVEAMMEKPWSEIMDMVHKYAPLLSPTVATCGPAGPNAAPFMLSFMIKEEYLEEAIRELRKIEKEYWGREGPARAAAARFLLDYVYNEEKADPMTLVSHLMSRGHTWRNLVETGEATISILIPPDRGALELRTKVEIIDDGPVYEYVNLVHDLMHVIPKGKRGHPWFPALVFRVVEIYDNSFQRLGVRIYPPGRVVVASDGRGNVYPGHFGDARVYLVFEVRDYDCVLVEERPNPYSGIHEHGHGGKREKITRLVGDAQIIVSAAFGPGGREHFEKAGKRVIIAKPGTPVGEVLSTRLGCKTVVFGQG